MNDNGSRRALFLPDFCAVRSVFLVVVAGELLAFILTLADATSIHERWDDLGRVSLFVQWVALSCAGVLCLARRWLSRFSDVAAALLAYGAMVAVTYVLAELAWRINSYAAQAIIYSTHVEFLQRSLGISAIICAVTLRYLYIQHHWQRQVQAESQARFQALQARIRPHFLFNCMNAIASLTRSRPEAAEKVVEDLADLLRASLGEASQQVPLTEELQLCRQYLDIEKLRLGDRLQVEWRIDSLPVDAGLPALTLQPLIENAIYHGVEPLAGGGAIRIEGRCKGEALTIAIENPLAGDGQPSRYEGNRLAQDNVRQRLAAVFGPAGRLVVENTPQAYRVTVFFPYRRQGA
ncbi:MAG TPA: sensor histidine kinase [Gammaproteobacteria bacterium]|nr:sensor histidine kinase [Gammaproteobacteria bacterium]